MNIQKIKNIFHLFQAIVANIVYGFPSRGMTVIGVTGTDGKTTTTSLLYHILHESGKNVAMVSTVGARIGGVKYDVGFHVTNPASFPLQRYIRLAKDKGANYLVLEVTSHGIDQNRVWGIPFEIGVLTNITHEHLDYHKTWEEYANVKIRFVAWCHSSVVNMDDESYRLFKMPNHIQSSNTHVYTYSLMDQKADYTLQKFPFTTKLIGEYNKANCLAAIAVCKTLGIPDAHIRKAIATFTPPQGRLETVYDKDFRVIIDFAHTPNAFAVMLPEVRKITKGRLIHVFGSAGKRDPMKRPMMGKESATYADIIILTSEDPRDEKIEDINRHIESGITKYELRMKQKTLIEISDRKDAIEHAISIATKGDTVLLTGKSHEKSINYGNGEEPWDEFEVAKQAISKKKPEVSKPCLPAGR